MIIENLLILIVNNNYYKIQYKQLYKQLNVVHILSEQKMKILSIQVINKVIWHWSCADPVTCVVLIQLSICAKYVNAEVG